MDNHNECSTEVQIKGHESNGKLMGAWWLLSRVKGTVEKRRFTRQEYDSGFVQTGTKT